MIDGDSSFAPRIPIPEEVRKILTQSLSEDPNERPHTMEEVAIALHKYEEVEAAMDGGAPPRKRPTPT